MSDSENAGRERPEKLECPACGHPGGSPAGLLSWVCENPDCSVETFRVIDKPEPCVTCDTTDKGKSQSGGAE